METVLHWWQAPSFAKNGGCTMTRGLRFTEKWIHRSLWLVAVAFAFFLAGLASMLIDDLKSTEPVPSAESFMDPAKAKPLQAALEEANTAREAADAALEQATQKHEVAQANTLSARQTFENWIATRQATVRPEQDKDLIFRTRELDQLAAVERQALTVVEEQKQARLNARQAADRAQSEYNELLTPAEHAMYEAMHRAQKRVFWYRVGLTLPLLLAAAYLFRYKRKGTYWPFTWGFIFFALGAFFFQLVPYLPSYGEYVRNGVGIVLTVVFGRYAIRRLHAYLARQKAFEALPEQERRKTMRYDRVMGRLSKGVCPSCERPANLKDETLCHCPHCGFQLFDRCPACTVRKNALTRFCLSCGTQANFTLAD
jgi:predicted RNA-binding Zn-ribbon protein involved in translation (DUF1610 family)/murein DD-endopeptidase MepM/ murein hydrolase activator NlpD